MFSFFYIQEKTFVVFVFLGRRYRDQALVLRERISSGQECGIQQNVTGQPIDEVECFVVNILRKLQLDIHDASACHRLTTPWHLKANPGRGAGVDIFADSVGEVGRHGGNVGRQVRKHDRFGILAGTLQTQMATALEADLQIGTLA